MKNLFFQNLIDVRKINWYLIPAHKNHKQNGFLWCLQVERLRNHERATWQYFTSPKPGRLVGLLCFGECSRFHAGIKITYVNFQVRLKTKLIYRNELLSQKRGCKPTYMMESIGNRKIRNMVMIPNKVILCGIIVLMINAFRKMKLSVKISNLKKCQWRLTLDNE